MTKLQTIDADTLLSTPLPATRFVMDRLLPEGLHILAGAPKIGKSWLALWLCLCVAKGESVWDFVVTKGTVLYLCLEDSLTRIQNRLFQITEDAPDTLHFTTLAGSIGGGLEDQLKGFLTEHPGTVLVYKRLNNGSFQWPRSEAQLRLLDPQTFRWLMEGWKIDQPKAIRKASKKDMF